MRLHVRLHAQLRRTLLRCRCHCPCPHRRRRTRFHQPHSSPPSTGRPNLGTRLRLCTHSTHRGTPRPRTEVAVERRRRTLLRCRCHCPCPHRRRRTRFHQPHSSPPSTGRPNLGTRLRLCTHSTHRDTPRPRTEVAAEELAAEELAAGAEPVRRQHILRWCTRHRPCPRHRRRTENRRMRLSRLSTLRSPLGTCPRLCSLTWPPGTLSFRRKVVGTEHC